MKKISLIFLSLVLVFMVGCSSASKPDEKNEENTKTFLGEVSGKSGSGEDSGTKFSISFNDDGKTATVEATGTMVIPSMTFTLVGDASTTAATYGQTIAGDKVEITLTLDGAKVSATIPAALLGLEKDVTLTVTLK